MKRLITFIIIISLLISAGSAFAGTLNLRFRSQEQSNWCWAASSQPIIQFKAGNWVQQCRIVNTAFNRNYCCNSPYQCNQTNNSNGIAGVLRSYNVSAGVTGSLSFSSIQSNIDGNRPFIMGWYWTSGGGHALVGYGYGSNNTVTYWDPWQGNGTTTANYSNVIRSSRHNWSETITTY